MILVIIVHMFVHFPVLCSLLPAVQYSLLKELKELFPLKSVESSNESSSVSTLLLHSKKLEFNKEVKIDLCNKK